MKSLLIIMFIYLLGADVCLAQSCAEYFGKTSIYQESYRDFNVIFYREEGWSGQRRFLVVPDFIQRFVDENKGKGDLSKNEELFSLKKKVQALNVDLSRWVSEHNLSTTFQIPLEKTFGIFIYTAEGLTREQISEALSKINTQFGTLTTFKEAAYMP